jgi:hypothetical protein
MTSGTAEFAALARAMEDKRPPCSDDYRFIAEEHELDDDTLTLMRRTCFTCPLRAECGAAAKVTKPTAGMWAGKFYSPARRART